jgi:hypothetical protein
MRFRALPLRCQQLRNADVRWGFAPKGCLRNSISLDSGVKAKSAPARRQPPGAGTKEMVLDA